MMKCQVRHDVKLECPEHENEMLGYQCERRGKHTDHWISEHTIRHALAGDGYVCTQVEYWIIMERIEQALPGGFAD